MTFIYETRHDEEGWGFFRKTFKTLRGATSFGCRHQKSTGYLRADEYIGEAPWRRHVVAQWKNDRGVVVARVWV